MGSVGRPMGRAILLGQIVTDPAFEIGGRHRSANQVDYFAVVVSTPNRANCVILASLFCPVEIV